MATKKQANNKSQSKASKKPTATKQPRTKVTTQRQISYNDLAYSFFAGAMFYGFGSWAIDSGSIWHYFFTLVTLYFVMYFMFLFLRQWKTDERSRKTDKARRA